MKRRSFAKLMTLGAASMSLPELAAACDGAGVPCQPQDDANDASADNPAPPAGPATPEPTTPPVNVEDFMRLAQKKLPQATFDYITSGTEDEVTLRANVAAFRKIRIVPPLLTGVATADLSTTLLGEKINLPILLAPVAAQRMYHPEGALASARAAADAGTIFGVSSSAHHSVEEIARAADGPKWFQLYMPKDRAVAKQLVERVDKAGYKAIILTVDLGERKDADRRNQFKVPHPILLKHLRDVGFNVDETWSYDRLLQFNANAWDLALTWDVFKWLRSLTPLPLLIKGVLSPADALKAVEMGVDGIVVSNHGGRRLDGMPPSIDVLPSIVDAVDGRAEILLDSGIRRGGDVLRALALGAKAVLIGRPYAWALAADGEAGVKLLLQLLREELQLAMTTCGCATVTDINESLIHRT